MKILSTLRRILMALGIDAARSTEFPAACAGRDLHGRKVLDPSIPIAVEITVVGEGLLFIRSQCPYNYGHNGHYCQASHPGAEVSAQERVLCRYALDLPSAIDDPPVYELAPRLSHRQREALDWRRP